MALWVRRVWKIFVRVSSGAPMILMAAFTMRCSLLAGGGAVSIPYNNTSSDDALNGASAEGADDGGWDMCSNFFVEEV